MDAVLADIDGWFATAIFAPLEQASDPSVAVTTMMKDVTAYFRSGGRVCLVGRIGLGASGDVFSMRIRGYFMRWISALARCLEAGQVPPPTALSLAEEAVAGIQGAIVLARALGDEAAFLRIVHRHEAILRDAIACRHG